MQPKPIVPFTRWIVLLAALSGAISVTLGAMAAHSLPTRL